MIEKKILSATRKSSSFSRPAQHLQELQEKQMQEQLGLKDVDGMTVLMHAARSCDVAMVGVILTLIKSSKVSGRRVGLLPTLYFFSIIYEVAGLRISSASMYTSRVKLYRAGQTV